MLKTLKFAGIGLILLAGIFLSCQGIPEFITQVHIQRGTLLKNEQRYEEAIADFTYAINSKYSVRMWAYGERELIYYTTDHLDLALEDCNKAIALEPRDNYAYTLRAQVFLRKGETDKAMEDCDTSIRLNPNAAAYTIRATVYYQQKAYLQALQDLQKALLYDPNQGDAYYVRGLIYTKAGEIITGSQDLAMNDLNKAIKLTPEDARFYFARSFVYSLKDDNISALADLNKALALADDPELVIKIEERIKEIAN